MIYPLEVLAITAAHGVDRVTAFDGSQGLLAVVLAS
jgi:hypothetical protein